MQDISMAQPGAAASPSTLPVRLLVALAQAAALYFLVHTNVGPDSVTWQNASPQLFMPLVLVAVFMPLAVMLGCGQLRPLPLAIWALAVALVVAGLGYYDALRGHGIDYGGTPAVPFPWHRLWLAITAAGFVGQVLVTDRFAARRDMPQGSSPYSNHFNTAWKLGLQIALAALFVGVFWLVLQLGASLFHTIGINGLQQLLVQEWFGFPATTLAFAVSLHITDIQSGLIRGVRMLVLTLFSWLLPLLVAILAAFLVSLVFLSLTPLWKTGFAASLLLSTAALLIFLINSCYQDGMAAHAGQRVRRMAATIGAIELVPLVALAIWALSLRIQQHGWTVDRIMATVLAGLMACYAVGYALAALRSPAWMKRLETTNMVGAYLFLALTLLIFSPIADPARLMVRDQIGRLKAGVADPKTFDYVSLATDGRRRGADALRELAESAQGPDAETIKTRAKEALDAYAGNRVQKYVEPHASKLAGSTDVYPTGRQLPEEFLSDDFWSSRHISLPYCANAVESRCTARFVTLRPGEPEALLFVDTLQGELFQQDAAGKWQHTAGMMGGTCPKINKDIAKGDIKVETPRWPDLVIGGKRLTLTPPDTSC